jgi:mono/diheme cytochrome c family protein
MGHELQLLAPRGGRGGGAGWRDARRALLLLIAAAGAACAGVELPRPSPADALHAANRWPGTSQRDLEEGRSLYLSRCTGCHRAIGPERFPEEAWRGHIEEMRERARLASTDVDLLHRYLATMAARRGEAGANGAGPVTASP